MKPFFVQTVYCVPVERFPNAVTVMLPQQKQRQHAVVNPVGVDCPVTSINRRSGGCRYCSDVTLKPFFTQSLH
jgi:hypothetical protein